MDQEINKTDSLTNNDLDKIAGLLDKQLAPLATKEDIKDMATRADLKETEQNLKEYIHEGIETIMEGIDNIAKQLATKERVDKLENWAKEVGEKVGVQLKM